MKVGIIVAQIEEARTIIERLDLLRVGERLYVNEKIKVYLIISGVGQLNAMSATYTLIEVCRVDQIINLGVVAGRGNLHVYDKVVVTETYNGDFDVSVFNHKKYYMPEVGDYIPPLCNVENEFLRCPCFSISRFLEGSIDTEIDTYVVDMEYYGVAYLCYKYGIPSISLKVVSDTSEEHARSDYESNLEYCSELLAEMVIDSGLVL